jgi:hypothetical protein
MRLSAVTPTPHPWRSAQIVGRISEAQSADSDVDKMAGYAFG